MIYEVDINGRVRRVQVEPVEAENGYSVTVDGHRHVADVTAINGAFSLIVEDRTELKVGPSSNEGPDGKEGVAAALQAGLRRSYEIAIAEHPPASGNLTVHVNGRVVTALIGSPARREDKGPGAGKGPQSIVAPMPGKVVKLLVKRGDRVAARQAVVVVEAMKMENELRSPKAGTVAEIKTAEGASVEAGTALIVIE